MTPTAGLSLRALTTSGMSAIVLGAAVTAPVTGPTVAGAAAPVDFSVVKLSAAVTPIARPDRPDGEQSDHPGL